MIARLDADDSAVHASHRALANHVPGLDGLRGLAAVLVVVSHTLVPNTDIGGLSVFLFFILSGFLITGILARGRLKIEAGTSGIGAQLRSFWINRALRILPAYYVWLALFLILDVIFYKSQTLADLGWYLLYAQNFLIAFKTHAWGDFTHTWSLAVEQQFYVFFAPLVLLIPTSRHVAFFILTIVVALAVDTLLMATGAEMVTLYPVPSTGFVFMAAGALIARAGPALLRRIAHPVAVIAALAVVVALAAYPVLERNDLLKLPYVLIVILSCASLSVVMVAILAYPTSIIVRMLETPQPLLFGRISYALYIIHLPVSLWMWDFAGMDGLEATTGIPAEILCFAAVMAVSVPLALLSMKVVEQPFLNLKRRSLPGKPLVPTAT